MWTAIKLRLWLALQQPSLALQQPSPAHRQSGCGPLDPLAPHVCELCPQPTGFVSHRRIDSLVDFPGAKHLLNYEQAVAADGDVGIEQFPLGEPFEDCDETGIFGPAFPRP